MLILSRKLLEAIDIRMPDGRIISVTVTKIENGRVTLGTDAPSDCRISRREIYTNNKERGVA